MVEKDHTPDNAKKPEGGQGKADLGDLSGVFVAGAWAFISLLLAAIFWPNMTERMKFFMGVLWVLVAAFAVIAQVLINRRQWQVMQDGIQRTDKMIEKMEWQVEIAKSQVDWMAAQTDAQTQQVKAALNQGEIMNLSLQLTTRAYVGIYDARIDFDSKRLFIEIENIGKVPAYNVRVVLEIRFRIPPQWLPDEHKPADWNPLDNAPFKVTVPLLFDYGGAFLFPGNLRIKRIVRLDRWLSPCDYPLIAGGRALFLVQGEVRFEDRFPDEQYSPFALRYSRNAKGFIPYPIRPWSEWNKAINDEAETYYE